MDEFHGAAVELFGEAGFLVGIVWEEARNPDGSSCNLFLPTVTIADAPTLRPTPTTTAIAMKWSPARPTG